MCCGVMDVCCRACCRACSEQCVLQVVVQSVSLISPGSTVCVLLVLQCVLYSVLECVLQGVLQRGAVRCKSGVAVLVAGCVAGWCCVWYGVVKCVLQGLCVEKCVVRWSEVCVAGFMC